MIIFDLPLLSSASSSSSTSVRDSSVFRHQHPHPHPRHDHCRGRACKSPPTTNNNRKDKLQQATNQLNDHPTPYLQLKLRTAKAKTNYYRGLNNRIGNYLGPYNMDPASMPRPRSGLPPSFGCGHVASESKEDGTTIGALIVTDTILGVPCYKYSVISPQTLF